MKGSSQPAVEPRLTQLERRRVREREIVASTRALFDARGRRDVPMDEIARAVGINRALIYRHFDSKDELFVRTMTIYLREVTERGIARIDLEAPPAERLRAAWASFSSYCLEYPAFLDCAVSLMRKPAAQLRASLTTETWLRLAQAMSDCLAVTTEIVEDGVREGAFESEDPARTVNYLYAQTIGLLHVARLGVGVARSPDGQPVEFAISAAEVERASQRLALAAVGL